MSATPKRSRRGPPKRPPKPSRQPVSRRREMLGKGVSHVGGYGAVLPLMLGGTAITAAATVHTWPAVVAMAIVLLITIIWVALGPTMTHTESQIDERTTVRQDQLAFARRSPVRTKFAERPRPDPRSLPVGGEARTAMGSPAAMRAWALSEGMDVHRTGPLPRIVVEAWNEHNVADRDALVEHLSAEVRIAG